MLQEPLQSWKEIVLEATLLWPHNFYNLLENQEGLGGWLMLLMLPCQREGYLEM